MAGRPRKECVLEEGKEAENEITGIAEQIEEGFPEEEEERDLEFFSTGSTIFDLILGKGICFKKMLNIVGPSSSGKSFIISEIIASARKIYGDKLKFVYLDCEAGYSFSSKSIWGFDIVDGNNPKIDTVEEFAIEIDKALDKIKPDEKLIYVIDSYDALTSETETEEYDKKLDSIAKGKKADGSFGMAKAKFINSFFRMQIRKIKEKNCLFIVASQTRDNINGGMFAPAKKRNGGDSLQFYSAAVIWLRVAEKYGKDGHQTGISVHIKNDKNKLGKPFREGYIDIIFDYGLDNVASNIKFLYDLYTAEGKTKKQVFGKDDAGKKSEPMKLKWDGEEFLYKDLIRHIESNSLERTLERRVKQKWSELDSNDEYSDRKRRY